VIGIASPANHAWLSQHGVEAVAYGEGLADRLRKFGFNAFIDCHGGGYVNVAIELGVPKDRIDTIIDFAAAQRYGVKAEGSQEAQNSGTLAELAGLVAEGKLDVPVAATFPLADVRAAFKQLEQGHTRGKIVLAP
jgi:NADPH:quinone reductase-like Zn-dependent oxidoreductase